MLPWSLSTAECWFLRPEAANRGFLRVTAPSYVRQESVKGFSCRAISLSHVGAALPDPSCLISGPSGTGRAKGKRQVSSWFRSRRNAWQTLVVRQRWRLAPVAWSQECPGVAWQPGWHCLASAPVDSGSPEAKADPAAKSAKACRALPSLPCHATPPRLRPSPAHGPWSFKTIDATPPCFPCSALCPCLEVIRALRELHGRKGSSNFPPS